MIRFVRTIACRWALHDHPTDAAAIAFYSIFTLPPAIVFSADAAAWALGRDAAHNALAGALNELMTQPQAEALLTLVDRAAFGRGGWAASLIAALLLLYGASAAFVQLRIALNRIFDCSPETLREQIHTTLVGRLVSAAFVLSIGVLELAVVGVNVSLARWAHGASVGGVAVEPVRFLSQAASWVVIGLFFAGLLKYLPISSPSWRQVLPGAIVSLVLFQLGKYAISLYLSNAIIASAYGASSSLVAIMIWIYYSSQTLLLGAEITHYFAERAERRRPTAPASEPNATPE